MEIYVQSAGVAPEEDYSWLNEGNQVIAYPPLVEKYKDLLQTESPSILLARDEGKLLLFVSGILTKRKDYQSRTIAISLAWVGNNSDEALLRYQASRVLKSFINQDSLNKDIDTAVKAGGSKGFSVAFDKLKLSKKAQEGPTIQAGITKKSDDGIKALAEELEKYSLPNKKGPLVVITGIQTEADLKKAGVYRALANFPAEMVPMSSKKSNLLAIGGAIAAVLLIVVGVTFTSLQSSPKSPELNREIAELPTSTSQNSEKKDDLAKGKIVDTIDKRPKNQSIPLTVLQTSSAVVNVTPNIEKIAETITKKNKATSPNQSTETTSKSEQQKAEKPSETATTSEKTTSTTNQSTEITGKSQPKPTETLPFVKQTYLVNEPIIITGSYQPEPIKKPSKDAGEKEGTKQEKPTVTPNPENLTWEFKLDKGLPKAGDYALIFKIIDSNGKPINLKIIDSNGKPIIVEQKIDISVKEPAPVSQP